MKKMLDNAADIQISARQVRIEMLSTVVVTVGVCTAACLFALELCIKAAGYGH